MFNGSPLQALHEEQTYFSEIEIERNDALAMTTMLASVRAVQEVQIRSEKACDWVIAQNCARIIQRLRDELYYRSEIVIAIAMREGIKTLFGEEVLHELLTHRFRMLHEERAALVFDDVDNGLIATKSKWKSDDLDIKALTDEQTFLLTVRNTPDLLEAIDLCRRAIHDLRRLMTEANAEHDLELIEDCRLTIDRVKKDLHVLCTLYNKISMGAIMGSILGHERRMEVIGWMREHTDAYELQDLHNESRRRPGSYRKAAKG